MRHAISLVSRCYRMDCGQAYAYLSAATDFDILQVDQVEDAYARSRKADFAIPPAGLAR